MKITGAFHTKRARIEIIPLIDIVFFLLATFVMVSLSMIKNRGMPVNLPRAETGAAQDRSNFVQISIQEDGALSLDKLPLTLPDLAGRFLALKESNPDVQIFISGDERARYGVAVSVLDEARKAGLAKVAFETRGPDTSKR